MLVLPCWSRVMSTGVHGPPLSRYESCDWIGLARTQNSYDPAAGALTAYDASPGSLAKLLMKSPPESWSRLTLSYHQGCRCIVERTGFSPSTQTQPARAGRPAVRPISPAAVSARTAAPAARGSFFGSRRIMASSDPIRGSAVKDWGPFA